MLLLISKEILLKNLTELFHFIWNEWLTTLKGFSHRAVLQFPCLSNVCPSERDQYKNLLYRVSDWIFTKDEYRNITSTAAVSVCAASWRFSSFKLPQLPRSQWSQETLVRNPDHFSIFTHTELCGRKFAPLQLDLEQNPQRRLGKNVHRVPFFIFFS